MTTFWSQFNTCAEFTAWSDFSDQILGYRIVFQALQPEREGCERILDYGCGPGRCAFRFVQTSHKSVLAVDNSKEMLEIAARHYTHPLIQYQLLQSDKLETISDNSMDGAMACFVFINYAIEEEILNTMREIHRVIKPGTPFVILDTNPDATGIEFATSRNGQPGRCYGYGEPIEVVLSAPGIPDLILPNYHWPRSMYLNALRKAGFNEIELYDYTLADISSQELHEFETLTGFCDWKEEWHHAPCLVVKAIK